MKKRENLKELQGLDASGLREQLKTLQHEMMNLKFRHGAGQLSQSAELRSVRRRIARVQTVMNARVE